jgi:hypothetical protein
MQLITKKDRDILYLRIKHQLGYPLRVFELSDEMLDTYFSISLEDYSSFINNWLIEQQWSTLQGLDLSTAELTFALTTKTLDFEKSFTYAYSKQVGLGSGSPSEWELKKDFVLISGNTQVYTIPADREVNEVLWYTPPFIDAGIGDMHSNSNWNAGAFGWSYMGRPAQYMQPTYSTLLSAQDRSMKRRIVDSEMTYRITAGANGTKLLYLYPIPGNNYEIGDRFGKHLDGSKVWYFYYDTANSLGRDKCLEANNDIIKLPNDVPIESLTWEQLNSISKTRVRRMFLAEVKKAIGGIRGFFTGELKAGDQQMTMDYRHLLEEGEKEMEAVKTEIDETLKKLTLRQMTEDKAAIAENINKALQYQPHVNPFYTL